MYWVSLRGFNRALTIDRVSQDVEHSPKRGLAYGHTDG